MPTIIDSLIVKLGLNSDDFNNGKNKIDKSLKDTANEAEKTGIKFKKFGKDSSESFSEVTKSATKFLALIGGTVAIKRFIEQTIESSAALDRFAKNLGASVNEISAWSNATEIAGGSAEGLQGSMDMLSKAQTELQLTGQSNLIPYLSQLGVSLSGVNGQAKPASDILLDLSDRFSKMNRTTANNLGRMMGLDQGTMNLLLKGRSEVELMIKRQKEYGAVTKQQAEESSKLRQSMIESRLSFEAFGRELLLTSAPALEWLLSIFSKFGNWVKENQEFVKTFLTIVGVGLAAIAASTIPINLTIAAVVALSAAIAGLYQDYLVWKNGGDSLIDWKKWEPGIKAAGEGIRWLKDLIVDLLYRAVAASDMVWSIVNGDWDRAKIASTEFLKGFGKKYGEIDSDEQSKIAPTNKDDFALKYFQKQGWSKAQSAGIVANLKRESGMSHTIPGDSGKAYGLAQWHPDRQSDFEKLFGKSIKDSSFEEQLAFVQHELTIGKESSAGNRLKLARTANDAASIFSTYYERPKDTLGEASLRGRMAMGLLGGMPGASAVAQSNATQLSSAGNKSVQTNIGEIKVYSAAKDAEGIAKDIGASVDYLFTSQANYGLS